MREDLPEICKRISDGSRININVPDDDIKPGKKKVSFDKKNLRLEKEISMKKKPSKTVSAAESISYMGKGE